MVIMSKIIVDFLRRVFEVEEENLAAWFKSKKFLLTLFIVIALTIIAYLRCPRFFINTVGFLVSTKDAWLQWLLLLWILVLTAYTYRRQKALSNQTFADDFRRGLRKWEFQGDWRTSREDNHDILIVTNSHSGGFAKPCRLWSDYVFEFETKLVNKNTSWIIRAFDRLNCVMLQCTQDEIHPHFRVDGTWSTAEGIKLPIKLPLNVWFSAQIRVLGTRVVVTAVLDGQRTTLFDLPLLEPRVFQLKIHQENQVHEFPVIRSFTLGSMGFRECGDECAHFRHIRVTRTL